MTEHWWMYRTGKCRPGCPGCEPRRRARAVRLWALVAVVLFAASFPARSGPFGVVLVLLGLAAAVTSIQIKFAGRRG